MTNRLRIQHEAAAVCWRKSIIAALCAAVLGLWLTVAGAGADDWPQFLGPARDGTSRETGLVAQLRGTAPKLLWRQRVGGGFSGPVVGGQNLILFHQVDADEVVECLDPVSGAQRWRSAYPSTFDGGLFRDPGPRSTPTIQGNRVYTLGGGAVLQCLDLANGAVVWRRKLAEEFAIPEGFFGAACSPIVEGRLLLANVGAPAGAGVVAFDCDNGKTVWQATNDEASYSSPIVADIAGQRLALVFARSGLHGLDPQTGAERLFLRFRARIHASVNAATPLVLGENVFLSASYNTGAALLRITPTGYEKVWSRIGALDAHYNTPVHVGEYLYGIDGRQEEGARLRCIAWKTGQPQWTVERYGCAALLVADGRLWLVGEKGTLEAAEIDPRQFRSLGKHTLLDGVVRAHPALAAGRLYVRSAAEIVCVDLRAQP